MSYFIIRVYILLYTIIDASGYPSIHGRYTRGVNDYQLVIPHKLTHEGKFLSFSLPQYFKHDHDVQARRKKRSREDSVHYGVFLNDLNHHLELWPNHALLSPDSISEARDPTVKVQKRWLKKLTESRMCQFTGKIRGKPDSRVAISTCDGLSGYIVLNGRIYFLEPVSEHVANKRGYHLHVLYERSDVSPEKFTRRCGTTSNWEGAWRQRLQEKYSSSPPPSSKPASQNEQAKRGLASLHRYLEVLIVADKKFLEYHKDHDHEDYILTVMNMVADFFHDSSSGNQMDVVVVRIIYLEKEEEEIDLVINQDSDATLASFCKWQQTVNPKDFANPNHHDIAVLLTRYDLCADELRSCGLMGLAYVAAACTSDKPCAINEDGGLILGIVVAHEIGHVMGCAHDSEEESGCKGQAEDESFHVMSPVVHLHTKEWSSCSRTFMTTFFDNDLGECLNDEPQISLYKNRGMLPGAVYDAQYQCGILFPNSTVCKPDPSEFCNMLLCNEDGVSCVSFGEPPADGTKCGDNKWCYNKKCVEIGERPEAVNGGWGEWGEFTACSRTCGGGASYAQRECNNPAPKHNGRYCLGERKKVKICNPEPCPEGSASFRAVQCTEFDAKPYQDKLYHWQPFFKEDEPCVLYCLNDESVFTKLAPRAKDGTKCKPGSKNMCISGVCMKVGCDNEIDSKAVEDICGVCQGDGTTCKLEERTYNAQPGHGYVKVTVIPKGSRNILVEELGPSSNTIAVSDENDKFFLNGDYFEQLDGMHDFGGVEGIYSHPMPNKEMLAIHGPLKVTLVLHIVYYSSENVGYRYKFAVPSPHSTYEPHYHWEFIEWSECSKRCGGGTETAEASCLEEKAGKVSSSFCHNLEEPKPMTRTCNELPCKIKWRVGKWSKCQACKDQSGIRVREVECVRESATRGGDDTLVDDHLCTPPKPGTRELCDSGSVCVQRKRKSDEIPTHMLKELWFQTMVDFINADPDVRRSVISSYPHKSLRALRRELRRNSIAKVAKETGKPEEAGRKNKTDLKVGTVVHDHIPPDALKLIEVPIKQSASSLNVSDSSFESMGDILPDTLDLNKTKVHCGKEAADLMKKLTHSNTTANMLDLNHKEKQPRFFSKSKTSYPTDDNSQEDECDIQKLILHNTRPGVVNCNNCSNPSRLPVVKIARMHEIDLPSKKAERKRRGVQHGELRELKGGSPEGEVDIHGCKLTLPNMTSFDPNSTVSISCNNCSEIIERPLVKNTDDISTLS